MSRARAHILITGRVQGVYYRSYARAEAERLNLLGWVRNCIGGSVEIAAEGTRDDIESMISWCRKGSPSAKVIHVDVEWQQPKDEFDRFTIEYPKR